jgi:hypothetical protein
VECGRSIESTHAGYDGIDGLMKRPFSSVASFKHIQAFLDNSRGQITERDIVSTMSLET